MANTKATAIQKPLIQIDDLVREMTDEEYAQYQITETSWTPIPTAK
jgi:hypothetical protein